ncbi:cilia- and flagella-associated protein 184 [Stegastes partitus]|uniref:Coiled-coil domain containing 96 n=1 Tax=Stegastes partitus TaxID=144197 RepID=A0A3B4ZV63_9TELE|nr:PREDICTED: coiled-coil domain-containing protein 96 [Stegastes partitus]
MDKQPEHEENEVTDDTERETSQEHDSSIPSDRNQKEDSEMVTSDHEDKLSKSRQVTEEPSVAEAATSEPEESSRNELPGAASSISSCEDLDVRMNKVTEQPLTNKESVVFDSDDGPARLHLETPEKETTRVEQEEEEEAEEEDITAAADREDIRYEEYRQMLQELCKERDEASQRSSKLQMKLAEYFRKKAGDNAQLERQEPATEQLQEYEKYINILTDLQQQLTADSESAQQQAEENRTQSQEKLDKVEKEWRALMALKQEAVAAALSRHLGKKAAQAKVESSLRAEQLRQDELVKLRLKHIKLRIKIRRLEAELRDMEGHSRDPLQIQFEQLQAARLKQKKHAEKQREESLKLQRKISSNLELLSNIKEKLYWSKMEVEAKRGQLAEVEAAVARKRELLTRTKQARNSLQEGNLRLKERRGLLGNRILLRDLEDTVDASDQLEEHLEKLKLQQAEAAFSGGRWKKKLEST